MINTKDVFVADLKAQVKDCGNQIDSLAEQARDARASEKAEFLAFVDEARAKRKAMKKLLHESEFLIGDAWDAAVFTLQNAARVMHVACDEATMQMEPTRSYPTAPSMQQPA
jgi:hypothetical protein